MINFTYCFYLAAVVAPQFPQLVSEYSVQLNNQQEKLNCLQVITFKSFNFHLLYF